MIGPLSNPALVDRQVVGVFDKKLLKIFAEGLKNLNIKFAWIVNSEDGLDEISPYAKTNIIQLKNGETTEIVIDPQVLNIDAEKFDNLIGDDANFATSVQTQINAKSPLASPTFSGTVTVPPPSNDTDAATKSYVDVTSTAKAAALSIALG